MGNLEKYAREGHPFVAYGKGLRGDAVHGHVFAGHW